MELTRFIWCFLVLALLISAATPAPPCEYKNSKEFEEEQSCLLKQLVRIITHLVNCTPKPTVTAESYQKLLKQTNCKVETPETETTKSPESTASTTENNISEVTEKLPLSLPRVQEITTETPEDVTSVATEESTTPETSTEEVTTLEYESDEHEPGGFLPLLPITWFPLEEITTAEPEITTSDESEEISTEEVTTEEITITSDETVPPEETTIIGDEVTNKDSETTEATEPSSVTEAIIIPIVEETEPSDVEIPTTTEQMTVAVIEEVIPVVTETQTEEVASSSEQNITERNEESTTIIFEPMTPETLASQFTTTPSVCKEEVIAENQNRLNFGAETFFIPVLKFYGAPCMSAQQLRDYLFDVVSCPKKKINDC